MNDNGAIRTARSRSSWFGMKSVHVLKSPLPNEDLVFRMTSQRKALIFSIRASTSSGVMLDSGGERLNPCSSIAPNQNACGNPQCRE